MLLDNFQRIKFKNNYTFINRHAPHKICNQFIDIKIFP
jgi:hypothetical protein